MKENVLDKGFIEVVDSLGNDLTVVNSARVSFGKRKTKYDNSDRKLVRFLAKYKHYSPFRHLQVQFHIKAPEFVITKSRDSAGNWCVTHTGLSSTSHMLFLNTDGAQTDKSGNGSMSANTSTVFSVNATDGSNSPNGDAMIAYCWHSVEGYSKFGSYTGNSNNDGPFIYTGFRPRMLFVKSIDTSDDWIVIDTLRSTFNTTNN